MKHTARAIGLTLMGLIASGWAAPAPERVRSAEAWLRWIIPVPKEASIERQVTLPAADVKITLRGEADELQRSAARRLRALFIEKAGHEAVTGGGFEIVLGVCDTEGRIGDLTVPDAARLKDLPNCEQAYVIRPVGNARLVLVALDGRGLFYAALTLAQLLESRIYGDNVAVPLAVVTDWPDLAERGEWGCSSARDIEWLAERKMNLVEFHTKHEVSKDGTPVTEISESRLRRGRLNAVKMVPIISHLNALSRLGVYNAYPELRGKGETARHRGSETNWAPCPSHPKLHEIVAGWLRGYAATGVRDISCWLSESRGVYCSCDSCSEAGPYALETRAFVKAWRLAREQYPDLRIRVLLTQGSYSMNDKVLAEVPPEVGITYYDGGKTYDSSPTPMIYPLLEEYAASGRWLGCYPQLTPSWRIVSPWTCPQFVKYRMTEFVDKKLTSLAGYVVYDNRNFDFNITAAAEWSWNAHGRDEREFALAWATRKGLTNPDAIADWALLLGRVSWDLYGARFVERYLFRHRTFASVLAARGELSFGQGMLKYIPDVAHFEKNLEACGRAMELAERSGSSVIKAETRAVATYYGMLEQLRQMCALLAKTAIWDTPRRQSLQQLTNRFALACTLNTEALHDWQRAIRVGAGGSRFREGVRATSDTMDAVLGELEQYGIRNPAKHLMPRTVCTWTSEDFREGRTIVKTVDVTDAIAGPGRYRVKFQYTGGYNGVQSLRAALASQAGDGEPEELSIDEHRGTTGHRSQGNVYTLTLDEHDPDARYLLRARFQGTRPQDQKPGRTGCEGQIRFGRVRAADWQVQVMNVEPHSDEQSGPAAKTGFSGNGIRVGVVMGAYGSEGILKLLEQTEAVDALPIGISRLRTDECQVVVLPQSRASMVPGTTVKELEAFVRQGGGLISTHDAVGYRALPVVCASVCAGGAEHVRRESWKIAGTHPVTAALPPGTALTQGYYDHILLNSGPDGTVVAIGEDTGKPVVVVGPFGKGRYVACGLLPGLQGDGEETAPSTHEAALLLNAVRWCAGAK